ncbi:MAG TPA: hypothetical protein VH301_05035 [Usitatibacter sp.]|nr:hypothetical protein [Usitatibacter sp.]
MVEDAYLSELSRFPLIILAASAVGLWIAALFGAGVLRRRRPFDEGMRDNFNTILAATLTLLALIIGFSFSMAINRYDQRKDFEEGEANAIGTEYVRAALLPVEDAAKVRGLLIRYLDARIAYYTAENREELHRAILDAARLQKELWASVAVPATAQPTPIMALVAEGMNDVLNRQGSVQAAWWNRIPAAAWGLMLAIAMVCNMLMGYGLRGPAHAKLLLVLPVTAGIAFMLIADIDAPRHGLIRVAPRNLVSLAQALRQ